MKISNDDWHFASSDNDNNGWLFVIMCATLAVLLACLCQSCKVCEPSVIVRDSIRVEQRLDSVYFYEKDSFYIDRWRSNDTVYLTNERWSIRYKDKLVEIHDTINNNSEVVKVQRERYVPGYYKFCSWAFWIIVALVIIRLAWWFVKKYYLHI